MAAAFKSQLKTKNNIHFFNHDKDSYLVIHCSRNSYVKYIIQEEFFQVVEGRLSILRGIISALVHHYHCVI